MSSPRRVLSLLVLIPMVLAAWLGTAALSATAVAVPADLALAHVYTYDGQNSPTLVASDAFERSHPVHIAAASTYDPVDRWSSGASARPTGSAIYTHGDSPRLGQMDNVMGTAPGDAQGTCAAWLALDRRCVAAKTAPGMGGVRVAGEAGEAAAGIIKNTQRIPSASGSAAYRIPDELNSSVIGEVKNVSRLSYRSQLRHFAAYAGSNGLQFNLYVRGNTQLSGPLQGAVNSGSINLIGNLP